MASSLRSGRESAERRLDLVGRSACAFSRFLETLRLVHAAAAVFVVQALFFNVLDNRLGNEVANAHVTLPEQADLCAGNVVLHQLLHHMDVVFPLLQIRQCFVDVGSRSLNRVSKMIAEEGKMDEYTSMMKAPKLLRM